MTGPGGIPLFPGMGVGGGGGLPGQNPAVGGLPFTIPQGLPFPASGTGPSPSGWQQPNAGVDPSTFNGGAGMDNVNIPNLNNYRGNGRGRGGRGGGRGRGSRGRGGRGSGRGGGGISSDI
jgi:hypothetical protein